MDRNDLPDGPVCDFLREADDLPARLRARVVASAAGPDVSVLAYRASGPGNAVSIGILAHPALALHRRGRVGVSLGRQHRQTEGEVRGRRVSVWPAGWAVRARHMEECEGMIVTFGPRMTGEVAGALGVPAEFPPLIGLADEVLEGIGETLWRCDGGTVAVADALARAMLFRLLERHPPEHPSMPGWFRRAEAHTREHLAEPLSVGRLAAAAGISPSHFSRLFKRACGLSPHEFVLRRRVERARELLRAKPDLPLAEIAARAGFCDQSHLTVRFREFSGMTPAVYRAQSSA